MSYIVELLDYTDRNTLESSLKNNRTIKPIRLTLLELKKFGKMKKIFEELFKQIDLFEFIFCFDKVKDKIPENLKQKIKKFLKTNQEDFEELWYKKLLEMYIKLKSEYYVEIDVGKIIIDNIPENELQLLNNLVEKSIKEIKNKLLKNENLKTLTPLLDEILQDLLGKKIDIRKEIVNVIKQTLVNSPINLALVFSSDFIVFFAKYVENIDELNKYEQEVKSEKNVNLDFAPYFYYNKENDILYAGVIVNTGVDVSKIRMVAKVLELIYYSIFANFIKLLKYITSTN